MTPFFAGALFGGILVAATFAAFLAMPRRHRREIEDWDQGFYDPPRVPEFRPPVATKITVNKRTFSL